MTKFWSNFIANSGCAEAEVGSVIFNCSHRGIRADFLNSSQGFHPASEEIIESNCLSHAMAVEKIRSVVQLVYTGPAICCGWRALGGGGWRVVGRLVGRLVGSGWWRVDRVFCRLSSYVQ